MPMVQHLSTKKKFIQVFDKDTAHQMFGYRLWFEENEMKQFEKRGKPKTATDYKPQVTEYNGNAAFKGDSQHADKSQASKLFQAFINETMNELS